MVIRGTNPNLVRNCGLARRRRDTHLRLLLYNQTTDYVASTGDDLHDQAPSSTLPLMCRQIISQIWAQMNLRRVSFASRRIVLRNTELKDQR